jgi:hypothetical protein
MWLLRRLLRCVPAGAPRRVISVKAGAAIAATGVVGQIASQARRPAAKGAPDLATLAKETAAHVSSLAAAQDELIVVDEIERLPPTWAQEFVGTFWSHAVAGLPAQRKPATWMLLFLISQRLEAPPLGEPFAEASQEGWSPRTPIRLPPLARFDADVIESWIDEVVDLAPAELRRAGAAGTIMANSEGVPRLVFSEVCGLWETDFYGAWQRWEQL